MDDWHSLVRVNDSATRKTLARDRYAEALGKLSLTLSRLILVWSRSFVAVVSAAEGCGLLADG
jgi:hypothetical protein